MDNNQNDFIAAVKDAFTRYADFSGVSTRSQYWFFILATTIASTVTSIVLGKTGNNVLTLITLLPTLTVAVRRMHDVGKSGWFLLIPIYNLILLVSASKSQL